MEGKKNLIFHTQLAQSYFRIIGPWEDYLDMILRAELNRRFKGIAQKSALEVGCGPGRRARLLMDLGFEVTASELSYQMLLQARFNLKGKAEVLQIDAHDLPFDDSYFDLTFLILTLSCVKDPIKVLQEAVRVTKRCVFIAEINPISILGIRFLYERKLKNSAFKAMTLYTPWALKASIKGISGVQSVSTLTPSWNFFGSLYVLVSDLYFDKILNLKPILKDKVKPKVTEGFAITFKPMGGQNEKGLSI